MKVLFRVDCDRNVGTGHLFRCRQMAEYFREKGCQVHFMINDNEFAEELVKQYDYKKIVLGHTCDEIRITKEILDGVTFDIIIVDFYDKSNNHEVMDVYAEHSMYGVVAISDDFRKINIKSDYLIATEPSQTQYDYSRDKKKVFCGERYCIVSREFLNNWIVIRKDVENILINFGGHDPYNVTCLVAKNIQLAAQSHELSKLTFHFLLGSMFKHEAELKQILETSKLNYNFYKKLPSVVPLFLKSDIAISACGNTIYELCNIGVPTIGIGLSDRQHEAGVGLQKKELIKYAGHYSKLTINAFNDLFLSLITSNAERRRLHKNCKEHFNKNALWEIHSFLKEKVK